MKNQSSNQTLKKMQNPDDYGGSITTSGGSSGVGAAALTGLVSLGANIYDSYQNRKVARENTDKTIRAQKEEAELAYQRSVEMWNRQNAYNTPQAQMARFTEAGLNPHLIYGSGGNSGNASMPQGYQPPKQEYEYISGNYGASLQSVIPVLMQVGTWMQDMRLKELSYRRGEQGLLLGDQSLDIGSENIALKRLEQAKMDQLIEYLRQKNPKELETLDNKLSLFPYQKQAQEYLTQRAYVGMADLEQDFRYKYGDELFKELRFHPQSPRSDMSGVRRLQYLQNEASTRLKQAQASYTDLDITNPQALMQMVLGGVMGLAGQTLRLSTHRSPKVTHEVSEQMRGGRIKTRRRIYER